MTWFDVSGQIYFQCLLWSIDAADALMLLMSWCCWCADADVLMHWCYWSNDAAVVDKMRICVWAHPKGIALSSEFRTVVQRLVFIYIEAVFDYKMVPKSANINVSPKIGGRLGSTLLFPVSLLSGCWDIITETQIAIQRSSSWATN